MKRAIFCTGIIGFCAACGAGTLTFAPGNGQTTNVAEMVGGTYDSVQINSGASGGGIVNLLNPFSLFSGAPTVDCGTLAVKDLRPIGQPSALGRGAPGDAITVKDGTFRYEGAPGETDRGLVVSPTGEKKASVLDVADGTSLRITGDIEVERGVMVKRGGGTLILAPQTVGASNQLAMADFEVSGIASFNANGDAPAKGFGNFTIYDGRVVIDTPDTSTNYFRLASASGSAYVGIRSTTTGPETEAHMEIRGGVNYMPHSFIVGYSAGDTTTAAQTLHHSLDVYGGVFDNSGTSASLYLGNSAGKDNNNFVSHLNIYGGNVNTFYFRPGQTFGNVSRTFISGGTLKCYGVYGGQYGDGPKTWDSPDAPYVPDIDIHICSNGTMYVYTSTFYLARDSLVNQTVRVTDGGLLRFSGFCNAATASVAPAMRTTLLVDGGRLLTNERNGSFLPGVTTKIGEKGLRWENYYTYTVNGPVVPADGVSADGGMELYGSGTFKFFGGTSFTGPVVVKDNCALTVSNLFSASSVTMADGAISMARTGATIKHLKHAGGTGRFDFGMYSDVVPKLTLLAWDVPGIVRIKLGNIPPAGTYELIDYPASAGLTADRVVIDGTYTAGTDCAFSVTTSGATSTLVLTVTKPGTVSGTAYAWGATAGGEWATGGNWSGGSAPGPDTLADLTFSAVPESEPITLTLDAPAKASSLAFPTSGGYRIAGAGSLALGKNNAKVTVTAAGAATNRIDVPVTVAGPIEFDIPKKGRVEFASVSGTADLTMNCSTRDGGNGFGGTVTIGSLAGFKGALDFHSGLLSVGSIPAGLSRLRVGYGEFRYTGSEDATIASPVTLSSDMYAEARIGVVDPDATLTIAGTVAQGAGGFCKLGQGTLALAGAHDYSFGLNSAYYGDPPANNPMGWDNVRNEWIWESNGRVPTYSSCMVAGGRLVWGGAPGQTVKIGSYGLMVGGISTSEPGKEYDAELDIVGGETTVNSTITVSLNHGNSGYSTASKPRLSATLNVSGGTLTAKNLYLALEDKAVSTADAYYVQTGGDVNVTTKTIIGYKGANCTSSFTLSGGTYRTGTLDLGESAPAPCATVTLSGGLLDVPGGIFFREGTNTLRVLEGATLRAGALAAESNYATKENSILFDGGTFVATLQGGQIGYLNRIKNVAVGAKGVTFDVTELTNKYFGVIVPISAAEGVVADGGITVTGAVRNIGAVAFSGDARQQFNGGVTVGRNGNVRTYGAALTNIAVRVKDGGVFGPQWTSTSSPACVASLAMGETADDRTTLLVHTALPNHGSNIYPGKIFARDSFSLNGTVEVAFSNDGQDALVAPSGTFTILIAPKNSIDASKFTVSAEGPALAGTFAVSSYNADYDMLTVTLTAPAPVDNVWTAAGSGSWLVPGNWSAAPSDSGVDTIVFPSTLAADAAVAMGGDRVVGSIVQSSEAEVSLAGGTLEFASAAPSVSTVSNGVLELPAVSSSAVVSVNPSANSGKVVLGEAQGEASFAIKGGTLESTVSNLGTGPITADNGTLSIKGDGIVDVPVTASGNGMILRTDGDAFFTDDVTVQGTFVKSGPGTAYFCGSGNVKLGTAIRDTPSIGNAKTALTELPSNGDLPMNSLPGSVILSAGKIVTGVNPSQYITIDKHFYFGSSIFELDANGDIVPAELEILGGTFYCNNDMYIGRNAGMYEYRYPALRNKRRDFTFTLWDGTFSCGGLYTQHSAIGADYYKGNVTINIHGGSFTSRGSYVCIGYHFNAANTNIVNIYGGEMKFTTGTWSTGPVNGNFNLNLYGGTFSTKLPLYCSGNDGGRTINYNFAGGTLTMPCLYRKNSSGVENLLWDGGVYKPTSNDCAIVGTHKTWTKNECRAGGAKFDLSGITAANATFTCDQAFTHQAGLEGEDGGVEMLGGGTLLLSAANTMNGPVTASGGTVKGMVAGSVPALVLKGGTFDGNGLDHAVTYLRGAGGVAANGSLSVSNSMAPLAGAAADAPYAVVANLAFGSGCLVACPVAVEDGGQTAPYFRVTESCTGTARLDFGRTVDDPLPAGLRVKVAECAAGVAPPEVRGVNTGVEKRYFVASETAANAQTGMTDVYAVLKPVGTMMILK